MIFLFFLNRWHGVFVAYAVAGISLQPFEITAIISGVDGRGLKVLLLLMATRKQSRQV